MTGNTLAGITLTALVAIACGTDATPESNNTSSDSPEPDGSEQSPSPPTCTLEESSEHPQISIRGQVCGETVDYRSGAGRSMHFGRTSPEQPENEVRVISVKDDPAHGDVTDESYFDEFGFVLNLAFTTGPEIVSGVSTHTLSSGLFASCEFGTLVFAEAPVIVEMAGVEQEARQGQIQLTLSGLVVQGYSERYELAAVPQCGGEVDIVIEGPFEHR